MPLEPLDPNEGQVMPINPGMVRGTLTPLEGTEQVMQIPKTPTQKVIGRFFGTDVDDPIQGIRAASIVGGGMIGAHFGAAMTPPANVLVNPATGGLFFGILGLIGGAVFPEATMQLGEELGVLPAGFRAKHGLTDSEAWRVAEGEALLDLYTLGGVSAMRYVGRGMSRGLTAIDEAGRQLAELSAEKEIALLPVQIGDGTIARGFVSIMGRFPIIGGPIRKQAQEAERKLAEQINSAAGRIAPVARWNEISEKIYSDARTLVDDLNTHFEIQYEDLWRAADEAGVTVTPEATVRRAGELREKILTLSNTAVSGEDLGAGVVLDRLAKFLDRRISPMGGMKPVTFPAGQKPAPGQALEEFTFKDQRLQQMDGLLSAIDQEIASLEPGQKKFAIELLGDLRRAVQLDVISNMKGEGAAEITARMRALDQEFSGTISGLFETATANRFVSVQRRGLRGVTADTATRMPVDQLARTVLQLDSPQAMRELANLVEPGTFKAIASAVIDDAVQSSMSRDLVENTISFDPRKFAKAMGMSKDTASRREAIEFMLKQADSPLSAKDFETLSTIAERVASLPIPNVSTFIARRGVIGGAGSILSGMLPGIALAGGGYASHGFIGSIIGLAAFAGGGRLISKMISDPLAARALKYVMSDEATKAGRRIAMFQAFRFGLFALQNAGEIGMQELLQLQDKVGEMLRQFDQAVQDMGEE